MKRRTTEQVIKDEMKNGKIKIMHRYPRGYSTRSSSKELLISMFPDHPY